MEAPYFCGTPVWKRNTNMLRHFPSYNEGYMIQIYYWRGSALILITKNVWVLLREYRSFRKDQQISTYYTNCIMVSPIYICMNIYIYMLSNIETYLANHYTVIGTLLVSTYYSLRCGNSNSRCRHGPFCIETERTFENNHQVCGFFAPQKREWTCERWSFTIFWDLHSTSVQHINHSVTGVEKNREFIPRKTQQSGIRHHHHPNCWSRPGWLVECFCFCPLFDEHCFPKNPISPSIQ